MWGLFALLLGGCGQGFQSESLEENLPVFSSAALASEIVSNGASFNFKSAPNNTSNFTKLIHLAGVGASVSRDPSPAPAPVPNPAPSPSTVPAPNGGLITNFTSARYNKFQIDGVPYGVLTVNKSYNLEQIDNHTLRFEIQQGDSVWCCNNEASLIQRDQMWEPETPLTIAYQFMLEPGAANTADWFVLAEIQTDLSNSPFPKAGVSPVVTIGLGGPKTAPWSGGEHLQVWSQWCPTNLSPANGAGNVKNQILWSQPTDIVRGKWYDIRIQTTIINSSAGHLNVWIDGTQVVNYSGPVGFGYPNYFLYGVYRHTSPQNTAAQFKNMTISPSP